MFEIDGWEIMIYSAVAVVIIGLLVFGVKVSIIDRVPKLIWGVILCALLFFAAYLLS